MKKFSLGLEVIDFQKDDIFDRLVEQFKLLRASKYSDTDVIHKIQKMVHDRFGVAIELKYMSHIAFLFLPVAFKIPIPYIAPGSPYTYVPTTHTNHVFFKESEKGGIGSEVDKNLSFIELYNTKNTVDIKNAKLGGEFSEMTYELVMNTLLRVYITEEEEVAIFLHEVGHIFTFFEHMSATVTTNLVLLNVANLATSTITPDEKKIIFKKHTDKLGIHPDCFNDVETAKTKEQAVTIFLNNKVKLTKSSTGSKMYDMVSREQSADQFSNRVGAGRHLVTALDKLNRIYIGKRTIFSNVYLDAFNTYILFMTIKVIPFLFASPLYFILISYQIFGMYMVFNNSPLTSTYDNMDIRIKRVRNDLITVLKDSQGIDEEKRAIIEQLDDIDKVLKPYSRNISVVATLINKIFRNKDLKAYDIQRELEELAFNDLFIKSEKLRLT